MESIRTLLVFCEGPHDVAFCNLVFKCCLEFKQTSWKFSDYPAPLNQLFKTCMEKHAAKDLQLDMAHKFFLPDKTLYNGDTQHLILLFNTGGKEKVDNLKNFLIDFLPLLRNVAIFPGEADKVISDCKYLFLYDRDFHTPSGIFSWCKDKFSIIGEDVFISEESVNSQDNGLSVICMNNTIGMYVFSLPGKSGTVEDILLPIFEQSNSDLIHKGIEFIDQCFTWHTRDEEDKKRVAEIARRKKSIITVIGQRKKPGSSMSVIVDQAKLLSKEDFKNDDNVQKFVKFINLFAMC